MQQTIAIGKAKSAYATLAAAAIAAEQRPDLVEAQALWVLSYNENPTARENLMGYLRVSAQAGELAKADELFALAAYHFPNDLEFWAHYALAPTFRFDWTESARRWRLIFSRFPEAHMFCLPAAEALHQSGASDEAKELIDRAVRSDPSSFEFSIAQATFAERIDRWDEAAAHWDALLKAHPDDTMVRELRGQAIWRASLQNSEKTGEAPNVASIMSELDQHGDASLAKLVLDFEPLGDNCEFGIVQRHFGVEPLALLRWTGIKANVLLNLLTDSFATMGDPEHTILTETDGGFMLEDDRGHYYMHTFLTNNESERDRILAQQIKRMGFLKREFLEDLRAGEKTFVFKDSAQIANDDFFKTIADILATYGRNLLLGVKLADEHNPPGSLRVLTENIIVGHIGTVFPRDGANFDFESWRKILEAAHLYKNTVFTAS